MALVPSLEEHPWPTAPPSDSERNTHHPSNATEGGGPAGRALGPGTLAAASSPGLLPGPPGPPLCQRTSRDCSRHLLLTNSVSKKSLPDTCREPGGCDKARPGLLCPSQRQPGHGGLQVCSGAALPMLSAPWLGVRHVLVVPLVENGDLRSSLTAMLKTHCASSVPMQGRHRGPEGHRPCSLQPQGWP